MGVNDFLWRREKGTSDAHKRHRLTDNGERRQEKLKTTVVKAHSVQAFGIFWCCDLLMIIDC